MKLEQEASLALKQNNQTNEFLINLLAFQLDHHRYTLPIELIDQIIDMVAITHLPEVNDFLEGIFNYHGTMVPVLNLRRFLSLPKLPIHLHTPIILVRYSGHILGLIVDKVIGVTVHPQSSIFLPKDLLPDDLVNISFLDGVIQTPESFMLMLNLEQFLSPQRKQYLTEVLDHLVIPSPATTERQIITKPSIGMVLSDAKPGIAEQRNEHVGQDATQGGNHKPHKQKPNRKKSTEVSRLGSNATDPQESTD